MMRLRGRLDEERRSLSGGPTRAALASPPHAALSEPLCRRCKQQQWRQVETCIYKPSNIGIILYNYRYDCSCGSRLVRFLPPIFPPASRFLH